MEKSIILESGSTGRGVNYPGFPNDVARPAGCNIWLMEYTVSGAGKVETASGSLITRPGSFLLYAPSVPQFYRMDPDTGGWDHIWLCFAPRAHWHDWLHWQEAAEGIYYLESPDDARRGEVLARMERALEISSSMLIRRQDFIMTIIEEVLLYCDIWNPRGRSAQLDERVTSALEYLCANLGTRITLQDLAEEVSLSPSRLSHLFKEQVGQSPMKYLEERRIERASELLLMTREPVSQIAYDTGFSSPFYFSRFFKSRTGMSPSRMRASGMRRGDEREDFWRKPLEEMTGEEWEALCDGCGLCCRIKVEDEDTGEVEYTSLACRLLDIETCRCRDYDHRRELVPECIQLSPATVSTITWLPSSCAYRLLAEGYDLPEWHPLITGDPGSTHREGMSVKDKAVSEEVLGSGM